jgi:putative PIN family toxin of toxin-antitoxin system
MLRLVLDTNVIVSALLFSESTSRKAVDQALDTSLILISQPIVLELTKVLKRKKLNKYLQEEERIKFLANFLKDTKSVEINQVIDVCRDKKDNKFIELAICGIADYIITGDEDLLILNPYHGISIIRPRQFLEINV